MAYIKVPLYASTTVRFKEYYYSIVHSEKKHKSCHCGGTLSEHANMNHLGTNINF